MSPWLTKIHGQVARLFSRRLSKRYICHLPIQLTPEDGSEPLTCDMTNWSEGGVFIPTPTPFALESHVMLEITIGALGGSVLRLRAQVVQHQKDPATQEVVGMGLMFTDLASGAMPVLRDFIKNLYAH